MFETLMITYEAIVCKMILKQYMFFRVQVKEFSCMLIVKRSPGCLLKSLNSLLEIPWPVYSYIFYIIITQEF